MFVHLNIVHTVCHDQWGGLERRVFNESRWMTARGHHVCIIAPEGSPLFKNAASEGWMVHPMGFTRGRAPADLLGLRRLLQEIRPDVLNTHGNSDTKVGLFAAAGLDIPCVILSRHVTAAVRNSWYNRRLYRDLCHRVLTTSHVAARQISKNLGVDDACIRAVPSGIIPPVRLMARDAARQILADQLKRPRNTRFIGFVGRLSPEKGLGDLVDAFAGIQDRCPDHDLVLVGEGGDREALTARIREKGLGPRVHMPGHLEDPWPLFRAFDCKVLASPENEGIPQSLLEAMFARCPVIGTAVGGIPDIIRHGVTGLLARPGDPTDLGAALGGIVDNPDAAERRAEAAHQLVLGAHSIDSMGETILSIYDGVLRARCPVKDALNPAGGNPTVFHRVWRICRRSPRNCRVRWRSRPSRP